ncbi:oligosaccharide repeat unit polymerase, partial [Sphingobacteriales bacterium CHB3]|nr:oligosaccharide repeat unit polymerase [Sphingobacteriales bacterium CHB3]
MNSVSIVCFGICVAVLLSYVWRKTDILSPARFFGFVWCLSIGLTELKFSALQHSWTIESWFLLLLGVGAFLLGTFIAYIVNVGTPLLSIKEIRERLKGQQVREKRLFWLILICVIVYSVAYTANYLVRGWLPVDVIGTAISRVDFNVSGLTLFLYIASIIMLFTLLYFVLVNGHKKKKSILAVLLVLTGGSFFLLLMRFPIIMVAVVGFTLLYYATSFVRLRTAVPLFVAVAAFFY